MPMEFLFPGMDAPAICNNLDKNCWDGCNKTQGQCDWCGQGTVYIYIRTVSKL